MAAASARPTWWDWLLNRPPAGSLDGLEYRVAFTLYSQDGQREVEVRELRNRQAYMLEREWIDGAWKDRHDGRMVGPFRGARAAERLIVGTTWFTGASR